ncbi:2-C-methyl-D-erythritol 4-phosphate cytidylyltransferase [Rhodoferax sp. GW822-FHT02A01]|uniref:2-C-methyl-D-erythritol 4-phosphate cytidylyltransferase n=1 Tax=Rhodoferax sp. GW822-FHT02A01 TaxID=3141537 RepID=UPI00315CA9C4
MPQTPLQTSDTFSSQTAAEHDRLWALIPCAGNGSRSGAQGPKQYQSVAGKPMVMHTLAAFAGVARLAGTLVVVSAGDGFFEKSNVPVQVSACGGATRAQTVANGLHALLQQGASPQDWVLVHDAARCLVTAEQINALIDACLLDAVGGLLALPLPDTLKQGSQGRVACTLERSDKWLAQTPQMFRIGALQAALAAVGDAVTDESSAMEAMGQSPLLVHGSAQNFKVTYPQDFALAESVLLSRRN